MKRVVITSLIAGLCCSPVADGAENGKVLNEHLQQMAPLIGTWMKELTAEDNIPDTPVKKGDTFYCYRSYERCLNGNAIRTSCVYKDADGAPFWESDVGLIGWDPAKERIIEFRMSGQGARGRHAYYKTANGWLEVINAITPGGAVRSMCVEINMQGNKLTRKNTSVFRDGESQDDGTLSEYVKQQ